MSARVDALPLLWAGCEIKPAISEAQGMAVIRCPLVVVRTLGSYRWGTVAKIEFRAPSWRSGIAELENPSVT